MSAIYEYLMQAREQDIKRRIKQASGRSYIRNVQRSKVDPAARECR